MKRILLTGLVCSLAACSSTVTRQSTVGRQHHLTSVSSENGEAVRRAVNQASDYCAKRHEQVIVTALSSNYKAVNVPHHYQYQTSITFVCGPIRPSNL
ncbi:MAG: hypothetical protein CMF39_04410 [Legionellaceae bacterium]|nr:hypothetical protein [Legionellaceae bacterium]